MSMRDKAERDKLRLDQWNRDYSVVITSKSVLELLTIADERDLLQAELTQEQNATQEWRVVADGMEKRLADCKRECVIVETQNEEFVGKLEKAQEELERLRNCVPGDVERLINEYVQLNADWVMLSSTSERVKAFPKKERKYNELLALIGSLIERKREDLEGAFVDGSIWLLNGEGSNDVEIEAKAYADRKMKGVKK